MQDNKPFQWTDELVKKFANNLFVDKMADDKAISDFKASCGPSKIEADWVIQCLVVDTRNYWLQKSGLYKNELLGKEHSADDIMKWPGFKYIHSVKRLSNGEIFSIGDEVKTNAEELKNWWGKITEFWITGNSDMHICYNGHHYDISTFEKKAIIPEEKPTVKPPIGNIDQLVEMEKVFNAAREVNTPVDVALGAPFLKYKSFMEYYKIEGGK